MKKEREGDGRATPRNGKLFPSISKQNEWVTDKNCFVLSMNNFFVSHLKCSSLKVLFGSAKHTHRAKKIDWGKSRWAKPLLRCRRLCVCVFVCLFERERERDCVLHAPAKKKLLLPSSHWQICRLNERRFFPLFRVQLFLLTAKNVFVTQLNSLSR